MDNLTLGQYASPWGPLAPEILLCALGLLLLVLDLVIPREKKHILVGAALVGLLAALAACVAVLGNMGLMSGSPNYPKWLADCLRIDDFAMIFKILILVATILALLASPDYAKKRFTSGLGEYYALLVFAALGMTLMVGAVDLISIYIAMEFTSLTSYVLVGYMKRDARAAEAGIKYYLIGVVSSALMLYGMSLLYGYTGSTNLADIGTALWEKSDPALAVLSLVLLLAGFGFKLAAVPFHLWTPEAYEGGPTPFIALLSVGPKAAGFAILLRVLEMAFPAIREDWTAMISALAALSMLLGNLVAIPQTNIKRMLAYSSIGQVGYILIGVAATTTPGNDWRMSGIVIYLLTYLFMNVGAFIVITAVSNVVGSDEIEEYSGLIRSNPLCAVALVLFLASLAGLPPTAGFWGKAFVFGAAINSKLAWLAVVGIFCSVVSVFYYFNIVRLMFFQKSTAQRTGFKVPALLVVGIVIALMGTLGIGLYPEPLIQIARASTSLLAVR